MRNQFIGLAMSLAGVLGAASSTPLHAQSTAPRPDFAGVWKMDTTKFHKRDAELAALTLSVARRGDTLVIITDVEDTNRPPLQMRSHYVPDRSLGSKELADSSLRASRFMWEGDTLVLRRVERRPDRTLTMEERWMLDGSGHTLSRLQTVADGPRVSRQTLVFTRQ